MIARRTASPLALLGAIAGCTFSPAGGGPAASDAARQTSDGTSSRDAEISLDSTLDAAAAPDGSTERDGSGAGPDGGGAVGDGPVPSDIEAGVDAGDGGGPGAPDASSCPSPWSFAPSNFDPCAADLPSPSAPAALNQPGTYDYDTDTHMLKAPDTSSVSLPNALLPQPQGPSARVVAVLDLSIAAGTSLRVRGPVPLVLFVHGAAQIDGTITAESGRDGAPCIAALPGDPTMASPTGGGGGGGGGFLANGGNGGNGAGPGHGAHGNGGRLSGTPDLVPLRGGCSGAQGGDEHDQTMAIIGSGGAGGAGAGAIQLSARDRLVVTVTSA